MRKTYRPALAVVIVLLGLCPAVLGGVKTIAKGSFVDSGGQRHDWRVSDANTLIWDDAPYLPAGVVFTSNYLSNQTDDTWQADVKELEVLKSKTITDLLVRAGGPATSAPAAAWQKLVNYLDEQGFTYGIELDDGPERNASGYIVNPRRYKLPGLTESGELKVDLPHALGGFFVTVDPSSGAAFESGVLYTSDNKAVLNVDVKKGPSPTLVIFPIKEMLTARGAAPDVWQGYDETRDRLIDLFSEIKFGSGLRFFMNPFRGGMAPVGEAGAMIPDCPGFRVEFEGWLSLKYEDPDSLIHAWGFTRPGAVSFEVAARLIPLWWESVGVPLAYDRAADSYIEVDTTQSAIWRDILEFRDASLQSYMNAAADTLKRFAADVPVVFTPNAYHSVYANSLEDQGFDGLSVAISGSRDSVTKAAGEGYALALDSAKTTWLIGVEEVNPDSAEPVSGGPRLKELGSKGFFLSARRDGKDSSLSEVALDALVDFKRRALASAADYTPRVLSYPAGALTGAEIKKLDYRTWWLPTLRAGYPSQFGENIFGYTLSGDFRTPSDAPADIASAEGLNTIPETGVCLWSNGGPITITVKLRKQPFAISASNQDAVQMGPKKDSLIIRLSETPIVVYGLTPDQLFPVEIAEAELALLEQAVAAASRKGAGGVVHIATIDNARRLLKESSPLIAYNTACSSLNELLSSLNSYVWIEGETSHDNSFDEVVPSFGASAGKYLKLSTQDEPSLRPYGATYTFDAAAEGTHELWLAGAEPGQPGVSNLSYSIDGADWRPVAPRDRGTPYAEGLSWFNLGSVNLQRGPHSLALRVSRSQPEAQYYAVIDVILLTKAPFTPDGIKRPPLFQQQTPKPK